MSTHQLGQPAPVDLEAKIYGDALAPKDVRVWARRIPGTADMCERRGWRSQAPLLPVVLGAGALGDFSPTYPNSVICSVRSKL
jgi:hypothetical protein